MKKNVWTKALTFISAAVMAAAVGLGAGINVHADDEATPIPDGKTRVTLTKLAVESPANVTETGLDRQENLEAGDVVPNADFAVYDVTDAYWKLFGDEKSTDSASLNKNEAVTDETTGKTQMHSSVFTELGDPIDNGTTNDSGQIDFDLANYNTANQYKVYLFRETSAPKGYTYSPDFVLSMPAKLSDGTLTNHAYVYPKDEVAGNYQLKFTKIDVNHNDTKLGGAMFTIKNDKLNKFAQVNGLVGEKQPLAGFSTGVSVKWVDEADATYFESLDGTGTFGFSATSQMTKNKEIYGLDEEATYTIDEKKAPNGYQNDPDILESDNLAVQTGTPEEPKEFTVTDTPEGILPHTGGAGIIAIVVAGLAITAIGVVAYTKRRANA